MVIQPEFQETWAFSDGVAKVRKDNAYGYIDKTGKYFIAPRYSRATDFEKWKSCCESRQRLPVGENDLVATKA